jgi:hypothetical protein
MYSLALIIFVVSEKKEFEKCIELIVYGSVPPSVPK